MTAISTDNSNGRIWGLQIEEIPVTSHGTTVTAVPKRLAKVHGNVDSMFKSDTLDLNTYTNGTLNKIRALTYEAVGGTSRPGSATFSGTTITFEGNECTASASDHASAHYVFGAVVELT